MCSPVDSSAWFKDHKLIKHIKSNFGETYEDYVRDLGLEDKALLNLYNEKNFWESIEDWTNIGNDFQFAGGEPLYDADHYRVLETLKNSGRDLSKINLTYATNLTELRTKKYSVFDYWKDYNQISLGFRPPQINEAYRLQKKQNVTDLDSETLTMIEFGSKFDEKCCKNLFKKFS